MAAVRLSNPAVLAPRPLWRGSRSSSCIDQLGTMEIERDPVGYNPGISDHLHVLARILLLQHLLTSVTKAQGT